VRALSLFHQSFSVDFPNLNLINELPLSFHRAFSADLRESELAENLICPSFRPNETVCGKKHIFINRDDAIRMVNALSQHSEALSSVQRLEFGVSDITDDERFARTFPTMDGFSKLLTALIPQLRHLTIVNDYGADFIFPALEGLNTAIIETLFISSSLKWSRINTILAKGAPKLRRLVLAGARDGRKLENFLTFDFPSLETILICMGYLCGPDDLLLKLHGLFRSFVRRHANLKRFQLLYVDGMTDSQAHLVVFGTRTPGNQELLNLLDPAEFRFLQVFSMRYPLLDEVITFACEDDPLSLVADVIPKLSADTQCDMLSRLQSRYNGRFTTFTFDQCVKLFERDTPLAPEIVQLAFSLLGSKHENRLDQNNYAKLQRLLLRPQNIKCIIEWGRRPIHSNLASEAFAALLKLDFQEQQLLLRAMGALSPVDPFFLFIELDKRISISMTDLVFSFGVPVTLDTKPHKLVQDLLQHVDSLLSGQ
jgi:hypothetical protein